jgi:hypothetical protein
LQADSLIGAIPMRSTNMMIANPKVRVPAASPVNALVVESADTLRSERSDASRAGANPAEGTNLWQKAKQIARGP